MKIYNAHSNDISQSGDLLECSCRCGWKNSIRISYAAGFGNSVEMMEWRMKNTKHIRSTSVYFSGWWREKTLSDEVLESFWGAGKS